MKNKDQTGFRATGLFLSGFQSIAEPTYIPLKPLTMLYGPNSAGKSAVIDAIGLFEDIAKMQRSQIMEKVVRWQHRDVEGRGSWPAPGQSPDKDGAYFCLRAGVEFVVPIDWTEHLDVGILEYKTLFGEQPHLNSLEALAGRRVHIDVGIRAENRPFAIRVAVDNSPIFESRFGELDDGRDSYRDSSYRREGDEGYDYDNEVDEADGEVGPLRIFPEHNFWENDQNIKLLNEFVSTNDDPAAAGYVRRKDGALDLYDVCCSAYLGMDNSELFEFVMGTEFRDAVNGPKLKRKTFGQGASENVVPRKRTRLCGVEEVEEILENLGILCKALLQLSAASLRRVHVSGSRQILVPSEMTLHNGDPQEAAGNDTRPTSSYFAYAKYLAYDETKSKEMDQHYGFTWAGTDLRKDHREVNRWLIATLPSLRGYRLRADAYMSTPLTKKREPFSEMDKFVYRLYLVDAQGRPHEFEDVGSGFSYVFPILVALWAGTWSIIEQPELHLHPAAQCDVADVFIAAKNMGHAALIESHSENLILRILRRIRETTEGRVKEKSLRITPDEVAVLYFDPQSDGTTKVKQLRISRHGDFIDRWPAGFFEERSRELFGE